MAATGTEDDALKLWNIEGTAQYVEVDPDEQEFAIKIARLRISQQKYDDEGEKLRLDVRTKAGEKNTMCSVGFNGNVAREDGRGDCRITRTEPVEKHNDAGYGDSVVTMSRAMQMKEACIWSKIITLGALAAQPVLMLQSKHEDKRGRRTSRRL